MSTTDLEEARLKRDADAHREISLDLIRSTSAFAVRTPRGQKDPGHIKWDPKASNEETSAQNLHALARNSDNIGIHLFGEMVDVDIDSENEWLMLALDHFLPFTPHVWGRASRPRTHRLYQISTMTGTFDPSTHKFLAHIAGNEQLKLEMRGGRRENARYSLMPGSLHPSGEYYMWDNATGARTTPIIVPEYILVKAIRLACVAALLAPYWVEGIRNSLCMSLSGFMYKASSYSTEMGDDPWMAIHKDDAEDLIRGIITISGDDVEDVPSRLKTLDQTWEKAEKGAPVRGATSIAEITGQPDVISTLYALLVDAKGLVEFEEFAKDFAFWMNENKVVDLTALQQEGATAFMSPENFHGSYKNRRMETPSGRNLQMTSMFLNSDHVTRFKRLAFRPDKDKIFVDDKGTPCLNQWTGFAIPPAESATLKDVAMFTDYIREILASGNPDIYHWIMAWCADIFQNPASKPGTALVLVGKPGAGKSSLGALFLSRIIGYRHATVTNDIEAVLEKFNYEYSFKLFTQLDEAINNRQKKDAHKIKALITDERRKMELKNVNAVTVDDFSQFLLTSNAITDAVAIVDGLEDRRYTVIEVNPKYCKMSNILTHEEKSQFWSQMNLWADDEENLAKLHRFFLDYQYDRAMIRVPLETSARIDMVQASAVGFEDFLMHLVGRENPFENVPKAQSWWSHIMQKDGTTEEALDEWPSMIYYEELVNLYNRYRRTVRGSTPDYSAQQIIAFFKKERLLPPAQNSKRISVNISTEYDEDSGAIKKNMAKVKINEFPSKKVLTGWLRSKYGYQVDEENEIRETPAEEPEVIRKKVDF